MSSDDKPVTHLEHERRAVHIPNAEHEPVLHPDDKAPIRVAIDARDPDMDPQLVWRGKRTGPLEVQAPPIYVQEHVHPKALIEDLKAGRARADDLFGHFGLTDEDREAEVEFYRHTRRWSNRFILGDSLEVMTSLAEREGLRGKVQAIYVDPPYGIRFNSNFQWSTNSRDVKDGKSEHLTREPEQVRAFRDTWRDGIHSYLGYLRDRLMAARELLTESGSCFVQIGDENVHRVRALMDEVFGEENFVSQIALAKTTSSTSAGLSAVYDTILWYAADRERYKFRPLLQFKTPGGEGGTGYTQVLTPDGDRVPAKKYTDQSGKLDLPRDHALVFTSDMKSQSPGTRYNVDFQGASVRPEPGYWKTDIDRMQRLLRAGRIASTAKNLSYIRRLADFPVFPRNNMWTDTVGQN